MRYRPEIDGLRALAVMPVVMFHAGLAGFSGGFTGVDIFFVISGYLITSIIHAEIGSGRFSLPGFYERRIRRILPALFLVMLVCLPAAWAWMLSNPFKDFADSLVAATLSVSNILFWKESGYFGADDALKPLLHSWSLGVEEQFYITFPVLLLLIRRLGRGRQMLVLGALTLASFALAEHASRAAPTAGFFLLPTRAWELGTGAILALALAGRRPAPSALNEAGAAAGLLLLLTGVFVLDKSTPFPGRWALLPVIGTALVIACAAEGTKVARLLSLRPLVVIGLMSYSLYLWHHPLFAFARIRLQDRATADIFLVLTLVSLGLAWLSWRFVERPFRDRRILARGPVLTGAAVTATVLIGAGMAGVLTGGFPGRVPPDIRQIARVHEEPFPEGRKNCEAGVGDTGFDPERICVYGDHAEQAVIWGDSHAGAVVPAISRMLDRMGVSLVQVTTRGCPPVIGYEWAGKMLHCTRKLRQMRDFVLTDTRPGELVLVHGRWTLLLMPEPFDNHQGGVEFNPVMTRPVINADPKLHPDQQEWLAAMRALVLATMDELLASGRRVVLIYPVPEAGWDVPRFLAYKQFFGEAPEEGLSTDYRLFRYRSARAYSVLDDLGEAPNLVRVYPSELFCNTTQPGRCLVEKDRQPLYADDDHLAPAGAAMLARDLQRTLLAAGWLR